jgi:CBS domain containing-hemolysin-like protein
MDWISLLAIISSLLLIAFFYGIEIAFISVNKLSIELKKKQGTISGKTWSRFSENSTRFIGTLLVGLTLLSVVYGLLIGDMLLPVWNKIKELLIKYPSAADYISYIQLLVETILSTTILLFIVFIVRTFFRIKNEQIIHSVFISKLMNFFYQLFSSFAALLVNISEWILKYIFNVKIKNKKEAFTKLDLEHFFQQNNNQEIEEASEHNKKLFENALSLSDIKIRACLLPRKEIIAVEKNTSIASIKEKFIETKLSRIIVFENNIDNIIGYIHHLDLFKNPATTLEILHPIPAVPETMSATDLMNKFTKDRKSIAWVIDEFGGTAGIVTMEDLLEELFGEIEDEYDTLENFVEKQLAEDEYLFSGRIELDYIEQKYKFNFYGKEGAETLSGFIIQNNNDIPKQKQKIIIGNIEFDILHVSDTRIEMVKVRLLK